MTFKGETELTIWDFHKTVSKDGCDKYFPRESKFKNSHSISKWLRKWSLDEAPRWQLGCRNRKRELHKSKILLK
jgi:hypothetical protein